MTTALKSPLVTKTQPITSERKTEIEEGMEDLPFNEKTINSDSLKGTPFMRAPFGVMVLRGMTTLAQQIAIAIAGFLALYIAYSCWTNYQKTPHYGWEDYLPTGQEQLARAKMRVCEDKTLCPKGPASATELHLKGLGLPSEAPAAVIKTGYDKVVFDKPIEVDVAPVQTVKPL